VSMEEGDVSMARVNSHHFSVRVRTSRTRTQARAALTEPARPAFPRRPVVCARARVRILHLVTAAAAAEAAAAEEEAAAAARVRALLFNI
jgi:hypothetical protein